MTAVCSRCGKSKEREGTGSITQWISVCNCDQLSAITQEQDKSLQICMTCGKRVGAGRSGSLTQWIFRQDLCACKKPVLAQGSSDDTAYDAPPSQEEEQPAIGLPISDFPIERYKPLRKLGSGGNSEVYLCSDTVLKKQVAVKILRHLSAEQLIAFQNEAKATKTFKHARIVQVFDFGVTPNGTPYMVLEYVAGQGLDVYLRENGKLHWEQAMELISQVCDALAYAHNYGIFHRDIKPGNILILKDAGRLDTHLIDFGLAKVMHQDRSPTIQNISAVVGTPAYMSPEQAQGKHAGTPSEIYSLGCVAYECICGRPLLQKDNALATLNVHANTDPRDLAKWDGVDVPIKVRELIGRCLSKNPESRFQSAIDLQQAIADVIEEPGSIEEAKSGRSSSRKILLAGACLAAFVGAGGLVVHSILQEEKKTPVKVPKKRIVDDVVHATPKSDVDQTGTKTAMEFYSLVRDMPKIKERDELDLSNSNSTDDTVSRYFTVANHGYHIVDLSGTKVTDAIMPVLGKVNDIHSLDLSRTRVTDNGLSDIVKLPLSTLTLGHTATTNAGVRKIALMKSLRRLVICGTNVDDGCLDHLIQNREITSLDIADTGCGEGLGKLAALRNLRSLRIGATGANDEVIHALSELKGLEIFHIQTTAVTNKCIDYLAKMPNLKELWIGKTRVEIAALKKLANLRRLKRLSVSGLDLDDDNVSVLFFMKELETLDVTNTDITDAGIAKMIQMPEIKDIVLTIGGGVTYSSVKKLEENNIVVKQSAARNDSEIPDTAETLSVFEQIEKKEDHESQTVVDLSHTLTTDEVVNQYAKRPLRGIALQETPITDESLKMLGSVPSLQYLDFTRDKKLTDDGFVYLEKLPNLTYLNLNGTKVTNEALRHIGKIKSLRILRLMDTAITSDGIRYLTDLKNLKDIDVGRARTADGMGQLHAIKNIEAVRVGSSGFTDRGLSELLPLPRLKMLHLQENDISPQSIPQIAKLTQLNDLWLSTTKIRAHDLEALANLKSLRTLMIADLQISDDEVSSITKLKQVRKLNIGSNHITDAGLLKLASLPHLKQLEVTGCPGISRTGISNFLTAVNRPDLVVKLNTPTKKDMKFSLSNVPH